MSLTREEFKSAVRWIKDHHFRSLTRSAKGGSAMCRVFYQAMLPGSGDMVDLIEDYDIEGYIVRREIFADGFQYERFVGVEDNDTLNLSQAGVVQINLPSDPQDDCGLIDERREAFIRDLAGRLEAA